mmetsp:Transcript_39169/g.116494  ORF Transcript_39169/g.116494 Transcript_39169/m.116494 type:complete len:287 (-) Transcript_39169:198-1058(-)|eukprot:356522-Chlamydomonas_euryale.AAC.2
MRRRRRRSGSGCTRGGTSSRGCAGRSGTVGSGGVGNGCLAGIKLGGRRCRARDCVIVAAVQWQARDLGSHLERARTGRWEHPQHATCTAAFGSSSRSACITRLTAAAAAAAAAAFPIVPAIPAAGMVAAAAAPVAADIVGVIVTAFLFFAAAAAAAVVVVDVVVTGFLFATAAAAAAATMLARPDASLLRGSPGQQSVDGLFGAGAALDMAAGGRGHRAGLRPCWGAAARRRRPPSGACDRWIRRRRWSRLICRSHLSSARRSCRGARCVAVAAPPNGTRRRVRRG